MAKGKGLDGKDGGAGGMVVVDEGRGADSVTGVKGGKDVVIVHERPDGVADGVIEGVRKDLKEGSKGRALQDGEDDDAGFRTVDFSKMDMSKLKPPRRAMILEEKALDVKDITEKGEVISLTPAQEKKGELSYFDKRKPVSEKPIQLVRFPDIEGKVMWISLDEVIPNNRQPRGFFKSEKIQELKEGLAESGQQQAIKVVPVRVGNSPHCKLFVVDGERRFRALSELKQFGVTHVRVEVVWIPDYLSLYEGSLIGNADREPLAASDIGRSCLALMERYEAAGMSRKDARAKAARIVGSTPNTVKSYIRLLGLDPMIVEAVDKGNLGPANIFRLASALAQWGDKIDQARLARLLLDDPTGPYKRADRGPTVGTTTARSIDQMIRDCFLRGEDAPPDLVEKRDLRRVVAILDRTKKLVRTLMDGRDPEKLVALVRGRPKGKPPHTIAKAVHAVISELGVFFDRVVKLAVLPPPLVRKEGAPTFVDKVRAINDRIKNPEQVAILGIMARGSDARLIDKPVVAAGEKDELDVPGKPVARGKSFRAGQLVEALKALGIESNITQVTTNVMRLRKALEGTDLQIVIYPTRVQDRSGELRIVNSYRLEDYERPSEDVGDGS